MKSRNSRTDKIIAAVISYANVPLVLLCRFLYLYYGEKKSFGHSFQQTSAELGNFVIIILLGLALLFMFFILNSKFNKRMK